MWHQGEFLVGVVCIIHCALNHKLLQQGDKTKSLRIKLWPFHCVGGWGTKEEIAKEWETCTLITGGMWNLLKQIKKKTLGFNIVKPWGEACVMSLALRTGYWIQKYRHQWWPWRMLSQSRRGRSQSSSTERDKKIANAEHKQLWQSRMEK